jgi:HlyD family secretion protein
MSDFALTPLQSIQRSLIAAFAIIAILVFGIGGWAATVPLDGAVVAQGLLVVDSSVKKVQHLSGGIVKEIRVRDGDHVNSDEGVKFGRFDKSR